MGSPFDGMKPAGNNPAVTSTSITPNDSTDLAVTARALQVNVAGDVKLSLASDPAAHAGIVFTLAAGLHALAVRRVYATGTTATGLIALG